jgi:hypothetical protein
MAMTREIGAVVVDRGHAHSLLHQRCSARGPGTSWLWVNRAWGGRPSDAPGVAAPTVTIPETRGLYRPSSASRAERKHVCRRVTSAIAALALPLLMTSALARSGSVSVSLQAYVPKYCRVGGSAATIDVAVSLMVNAEGALVSPEPVAVPGVICNYAALITMSSLGGGAHSANATGATVRYLVTTRFGTATVTFDAAAVSSTGTTSGPQKGSMTAVVAPMQPAEPLEPGAVFTDTLRISLMPR